ncbi:arginine--tRNA ligase [soil metagenome]
MDEIIDPTKALGALVRAAAISALGDEAAGIDPAIRRSDRADFQADLAMGLARRLKKAPRAIAEQIAAAIPLGPLVERFEVAGPGFINLHLSGAWLAAAAAHVDADPRLGAALASAPERITIDYSAPNVAKEMHVGHLRSTVIGDSLARLLEWRGRTVLRQNHLGDWGTPFSMLIEHLIDLGETAAANEVAVGDLSTFYQAARKKFEDDPAFADRARGRVVLLQAGDETTLARWRVLVDLSKSYFESVYDKLAVTLRPTDIAGESMYNPMLAPLAAELEASGAARIDDGALCVFPSGFTNKEGSPLPLIIRKRDGGFGYATTDLAAIRYRLRDLSATRLIYVVGAPQQQHFAMIFAAAKELGWLAPPARAEHVMFGSVLGADKRMYRTRTGDTVRLVDLIDAAIDRADKVLTEKGPDLDAAKKRGLARTVGVGAIKYADLSSDRLKDYFFDIDRMVSFDGNSAGYLQYAHARALSIARRAGDTAKVGPFALPAAPEERALILDLLAFGAIVEKVEATLEPHHLTGYLYALATSFTAFFEKCPVLKADDDATRSSRLALTAVSARTIARGLALLGIDAPTRM